jgi:HlyD family secretion protein
MLFKKTPKYDRRRCLSFLGIGLLSLTIWKTLFGCTTFDPQKDWSYIQTTGVVEGTEVNISSMISGKVFKACCREGDTVQQGQVLIGLECEELKASLEQALAGIEKSKADISVCVSAIESYRAIAASAPADIDDASAEVEKARAGMEAAKEELDLQKEILKRKLISEARYDEASAGYKAAVARHRSSTEKLAAILSEKGAAEAQLPIAKNQLIAAQAALKESEASLAVYRAELAQSTITSPISGTIVFKTLEAGEAGSPGATIFTIIDLNHLYVRIDLEETRVGGITLGQAASIRTEGAPERIFGGKISEIGSQAEFATQKDVTRGRQDIKTFKIKIDVEDSSGFLKPGMTVNVELPQTGVR